MLLMKVKKWFLMLLKVEYFLYQQPQKVQVLKLLQRLPIALAQVKAGNISENLLNGIHQIIYSLYQSKEITKKSITI